MDYDDIKVQITDMVLDKFDFTLQNNGDIKFYVFDRSKKSGKIIQIYEPDSVDMKIQAKTDKDGNFIFEPVIARATFSNDANLNLANSRGDKSDVAHEIALLAKRAELLDENDPKTKVINLIKVSDDRLINTFNSPFFLDDNGEILSRQDSSKLEVINAFKAIYNTTDEIKPFFRSLLENDKILDKNFIKDMEEFYKNSIKNKSVSEVINAGEELQLLREFSKDVIGNVINSRANVDIKEFKIIDIDISNQNSNTPYGSYAFEANIKMTANGVTIDDRIKFETNEQSFMQSFTQMLNANGLDNLEKIKDTKAQVETQYNQDDRQINKDRAQIRKR